MNCHILSGADTAMGEGAAGPSHPAEISEELLNSTYGKKPSAKHIKSKQN